MSVRAKFVCNENSETPENGATISFTAVTSGSDENKEFFKWTPSGSLTLQTVNPAAASQFEKGKEYYLDFTAVDAPAAA